MRNRVLMALVAVASLARAAQARPVKAREFTAERNGNKLALYEKWVAGDEAGWKKNGKIILLVHGATWSSRCTFDPAPGYSLMDALADAGYDVWAVDLHGYGKSDKPRGADWTEADSAAGDIDAAVDYIEALRFVKRVHVLAYDWGTEPATIFATKHLGKVGKLVLFGMRWNRVDATSDPQMHYRRNTREGATLRDDQGDIDADFNDRRAQLCATTDPTSPNGALRDLARPSPVDPAQLKAPTLVIFGARDADPAVFQDRLDFYKGLAADDRWFVEVPGLGKYAPFERARARFTAAVVDFLDNVDAAKVAAAQ